MTTSPGTFARPGPAGADSFAGAHAALAWLPDRVQRGVAVSLLPVAASSILLAVTSDQFEHPRGAAVYLTYLIVAPVVVGLVWWRRRPANRIGPLLVAFGFAAWPISWQGSDQALLYNLGVLGAAPPIAIGLYLCLAFPTGRLRTSLDRQLLGGLVFVLALFYGASLLLAPALVGDGLLAACVAPCPGNSFQIGSQLELLDAVARFVTYAGLAVVAGMVVVWIRRFRAASRPERRRLIPVASSSLLLVPTLFALYFSVLVLQVDEGVSETLAWLVVGAWIVFPLGFAVALLQADLFAGRALRQLLSELANRPTPERWRDIVAKALDDPSLRLAYWDPRSDRFRDAAGVELTAPLEGSSRQWTELERDGSRVAALVTDEALAEDPELVDAAASATLLAVETGRLEGELRASRARAFAAGDAERRRIGRDLHDSAQQRLVALRVHLSLAGERLDPDELPIVEELERELDEALDELRTVARGIYPQVLARHGLAAALRSSAQSAAIPVSVTDEGVRRHPEAIELAVYFCCLEALQNAAKHAGSGASVRIRLTDRDAELGFRIDDDGRGFDPTRTGRGAGLTNLADRLATVGGSMRIESSPGHGTRVLGHIPV